MKKNKDMQDQNRKQKQTDRRAFLKKAAYSAPVLMAMGQLAKPTLAHADASGGPLGPPPGPSGPSVWPPSP